MSHRVTVARRMRDIFRLNTTRVNVAQHKKLRSQGDQLKLQTSPHQDVSKRTPEKHECGETIRRLRTQFEAWANAQADELRGIATGIKNQTLWRGQLSPKRKKRNGPHGGNQ
ncbi:hypothetical protein B7P43_G17017 [Cryptotermes secundus]|uniref:Uncharacterized protein n=1 Tax=Cryptotermes secundus TaxID=105785 RepID=A0A2J7Q6G1_9NEOP|nr:hypothetical protein B7P43_G17017 [Cryptotermes secundus]